MRKIIILLLVLITTNSYSQEGMKPFTKQDFKVSCSDFKTFIDKYINSSKNMYSMATSVEIDGSHIGYGYKKKQSPLSHPVKFGTLNKNLIRNL